MPDLESELKKIWSLLGELKSGNQKSAASVDKALDYVDRQGEAMSSDEPDDPDATMEDTQRNGTSGTRRKRPRPPSGTIRCDKVRKILLQVKSNYDHNGGELDRLAKEVEMLSQKARDDSNSRQKDNVDSGLTKDPYQVTSDSKDQTQTGRRPLPPGQMETENRHQDLPSNSNDAPIGYYALTPGEMEEEFMSKVAGFLEDDDFLGIINVEDALRVSWDALENTFHSTPSVFSSEPLAVVYKVNTRLSKPGIGWCHLHKVDFDSGPFVFPPDPVNIAKPSVLQARERLNATITTPPEALFGDFVGEWHLDDWPLTLNSDMALNTLNYHILGVNSTKVHVGYAGSATSLRCSEVSLRACQVGMMGWRVWLRINLDCNDELEALCERYWIKDPKADRCSSWINHLELMLSPRWLDSKGIRYTLQVVGPHQMVVMEPKEYHMAFNYSSYVGLSTCFLLEGEAMFSDRLVSCPDCLFHDVAHPNKTRLEEVITLKGRGREKKKKPAYEPQPEVMEKIQAEIQAIEPGYRIPGYRYRGPGFEPEESTARLATVVWSRVALCQFVGLVTTGGNFVRMTAQPAGDEDPMQRLGRRVNNVDIADTNSILGKVSKRVAELLLAQDLQKLRKRERATFRKAIEDSYGWTENKYKDVRARGNKWLALCSINGVSPGLLCFFMMSDNRFEISSDAYLSIQGDQQGAFVNLIAPDDYTSALIAAGNAFVSTFDGSRSVRFRFQNEQSKINWYDLDEKQIIELLAEVE